MTSPQFKWGSESRYTFVMQKPIRLQLVDFKMKKKMGEQCHRTL